MAVTLVTGACGFIGSHAVERLLGRGDTVVGFDNFDPFYARPLKDANLSGIRDHPRFRLVEGDLRDWETVSAVVSEVRPERVLHLAAKAGVRPSIADPAAYYETNVRGTLNLLLACAGAVPEQFVFASSSSVYGDATRLPFSETQPTDQPASPYAATKKAGEALCFTYHHLLRMPVTCLRFFTVFGPRQRPDLAINSFVRRIEAGEPVTLFGDGTSRRDYTYVDDTVDGILAALDRPAGYEIYNLGRSDPVTLRDLVEVIERVVGKCAEIRWQPDQPGDVRVTYADISRAHERLGYAPEVGLEEGIRRFVDWRRRQIWDGLLPAA